MRAQESPGGGSKTASFNTNLKRDIEYEEQLRHVFAVTRRAQEKPGKPRRAQESPGEPRKTRKAQ